jgi:dihydrodipicolinate synthase/N-acetylneuraminate lyase
MQIGEAAAEFDFLSVNGDAAVGGLALCAGGIGQVVVIDAVIIHKFARIIHKLTQIILSTNRKLDEVNYKNWLKLFVLVFCVEGFALWKFVVNLRSFVDNYHLLLRRFSPIHKL